MIMPVWNEDYFLCIRLMHWYWWNSDTKLNTLKYFAPSNRSNISVMLSYVMLCWEEDTRLLLFFHLMRKNLTILHLLLPCEPGFLETTNMNELCNEFEDLIISFIIKSFICLWILSLWKGGNLYCLVFMNLSSCDNFMCSYRYWPNSFSKRNKSLYLLMILSYLYLHLHLHESLPLC